jgi:Tfp pilus assembly protein PilN
MADIDMIPRSYREALRVRRTLAAYGGALALLLAAGAAGAVLLRWRLAVETPRLALLRADAGQADAMRTLLAKAQEHKDALAQDAGALAALRGAGEVAALAKTLDGAINDKVWFDQLRFSRTQELLREAPPSPLPPGTVQARTPQGTAGAAGAAGAVQAWRLASHLEIAGQASDNPAMSSFLAALSADAGLSNVRFLNSSAIPAEDGGGVGFGIAASLVKRGEAR